MSVRLKEQVRSVHPATVAPIPRRPSLPPWLDLADLQLLAEIGLTAAAQGYADRVQPIFDALHAIHPGNAAAAIGRALSALARRDCDAAIEILKRDGIRAQVCAAEAQALLAVALGMAGRKAEARTLCLVLAEGRDSAARKVAMGLLAAEAVDA